MANLGKIHQGDLSTDVQVLVQDTNTSNNNNPVNLALTTIIQITFLDPDGVVVGPFTAVILNAPGTDGIAHYITNNSTSQWNKPGYWKWFITYTLSGGGTYSTNSAIREVLESGG